MMVTTDGLEGVKEGDEIIIRVGYSYARHEIAKVDRVTKTWAAVGLRKFKRDSGRLVGQDTRYGTPQRALLMTPELRDLADRDRLRDWWRNYNVDRLSAEQLRAIEKIASAVSPNP